MTTTIGQTGNLSRMVSWIDSAWEELQTEHDDWAFMASRTHLGNGAMFNTVAGLASYPLGTGAGTSGVTAATFGKWDRDTFRNYTTSIGQTNEMFMDEISYDAWKDTYLFGANRNVQTRPNVIAIGGDESLCLGPPPNGLYTVTGDYYTAPTVMAADADVPQGLPNHFHMAIVYKAMTYYAGYEAAPEVFQRGAAGYSLLLSQLEALKLSPITFGGALA